MDKIDLKYVVIYVLAFTVLAGAIGYSYGKNNHSSDLTESNTASTQDYEDVKACFENVQDKLLEVHDKASEVSEGSTYDDFVSTINDIQNIADGGKLVMTSDKHSCPEY